MPYNSRESDILVKITNSQSADTAVPFNEVPQEYEPENPEEKGERERNSISEIMSSHLINLSLYPMA